MAYDPEFLIRSYGYPMLVAGTMAEGETVLIIGGLMASQGYLDLRLVLLCGFIGAIAGDQAFFLLGRKLGMAYILNHPTLQARIEKVELRCEKYRTVIFTGFRFVYGCRSLIPFFFGVSSVKAGKFLLFNSIGASLWAIAVGSVGYFVGGAAGRALNYATGSPTVIVVSLLCVTVFGVLFLRHSRKRI